MTETIVELTGQVELAYEEDSKEFQEALAAYAHSIERGGSKESMLKHVAFYVTRFGTDGMVEGVGYVGYNGRKPTKEPYSGIMVGQDFDEFSFEIG